MPDYTKSKIYKITDGELTYYGSTVQTLSARLRRHRHGRDCSLKILKELNIELVEEYPCNSKKELLDRERYYIQNFECVNQVIPNRTSKEYCKDNAEILKIKRDQFYKENPTYNKEYYEKNKDKVKAQQAEVLTCEKCDKTFTRGHKARHYKKCSLKI